MMSPDVRVPQLVEVISPIAAALASLVITDGMLTEPAKLGAFQGIGGQG